jgi:hypothetical protein
LSHRIVSGPWPRLARQGSSARGVPALVKEVPSGHQSKGSDLGSNVLTSSTSTQHVTNDLAVLFAETGDQFRIRAARHQE